MKISMVGGSVTATAETLSETKFLLKLERTVSKIPTLTTRKKSRGWKKRQYTKVCDVCGKECRGGTGLATHKRNAHKEKTHVE